jgi:RNA polymerase sigma-70 factor, ECF subfamily
MGAAEGHGSVDRDLVESAQHGDREAYVDLIRDRSDRLFAIAQRILRDVDRAEDALQDALVIAWRDLRGLRDPDRFDAWLQRLLINACIGQATRERRRTANLRVLPVDGPAAPDQLLSVADRDLLERGFRRLAPEQRAILVLHHFLGYQPSEIAETLGIPAGTARSRLHHAHTSRHARRPRGGRSDHGHGRSSGMNQQRDIERLLDHWFSDGPTEAPDRVIDRIADRIERQSQRHAWRLQRRPYPMNAYAKIAVAVAAVLIVALVGYNLLPGGGSGIGGPVATPTPTASPSQSSTPSASSSPNPSASGAFIPCDEPGNGCAGDLTAGQHTTTSFSPKLTYTVPAGWRNTLDKDRTFSWHSPGYTFFFQIASQVAIPAQNARCSAERKAGVGNAVADWTAFLTKHPGLAATTPKPVTIGDYKGMSVTFHVNTAWTATCPNSIGPAVMIMTDSGSTPDRVVWIDDQYTTFDILDVAGETVIVHLESGPSAGADRQSQTEAQPIIDSFRFTPSS